jgi:phosphatidylglycerol:prolipoprotein diacylglycerol transferase
LGDFLAAKAEKIQLTTRERFQAARLSERLSRNDSGQKLETLLDRLGAHAHIPVSARGTCMLPIVIEFPNIDPALVTIPIGGFEFALRWYALAYIFGLIIGWRLMVLLMRRPRLWPANKAPMAPEQPEALLTWMVLGVVLGGRLGYVIFYDPGHFMQNPAEILQVWQGGMSFHGGFIGVIVMTVLFTRNNSIPLLQAGDAVALAAPVGLMLGRLANFINAELYGRPTDVWWAMQFPTRNKDGSLNWDLLTEPRHPSQLYQAALEGLLLFIVMWLLALRFGWLKRPGAVVGVFFIGYGAARFFAEYFRQWDAQLSDMVATYGITMGQLLSLPMVVIGLAFLLIAFRRDELA